MPCLIHDLLAHPPTGAAIEAMSLAIIDREAPPHTWSPRAWNVARRLVHTTGDFGLLKDVHLPDEAITAGIEALRRGAPIYADANMLRAGVSLERLQRVNAHYSPEHIRTYVGDPDVRREASQTGLPRSYHAIRKAAPWLEGAIVAIGNAPVALLELNRMIAEDGLRPALVLAFPVGFVHVVESKNELLEQNVPSLMLRGRRGGSPLAVAALHALADLAERPQ